MGRNDKEKKQENIDLMKDISHVETIECTESRENLNLRETRKETQETEESYGTFREYLDALGPAEGEISQEDLEDMELEFLLRKEWGGSIRKRGGDARELEGIWDEKDAEEEEREWHGKHCRARSHAQEDWEPGDSYGDDTWDGVWGERSDDPEVMERRQRIDELWDRSMNRAVAQMLKERYEKRPQKFARHRFSLRFRWKMAKAMRELKAEGKVKDASRSSRDAEMEDASRSSRPGDRARNEGRFHALMKALRPARSAKVAVAVAAVMVVMLGTTVGGKNPIIVWMYETWMEQHGDYVEIEGRDDEVKIADSADSSFKKYELTKAPEGYEFQGETLVKEMEVCYISYIREDGQMLIFQQGKKDNSNLGNVTANRKDMEKVAVGEFEGYYIQDSDMNNLILSDDEYMLLFTGDLSKEELLELAGRLKAVE